MADDGRLVKQEEDYTAAVDELLPKATALATGGKLSEAIDLILPLEKKARIASDAASTSRLVVAVVTLCWECKELELLSEYLVLLSKRRGQLKQAVTKMVQAACKFVDELQDKTQKLKLIDTLRTVTAGKIHVEIERARLTQTLSKIKEADGEITEAAEILQDLQVETYGSMDKREKTEFLLEQMRLCLLKSDYMRTSIISKKISTSLFKDDKFHDLKLKFYRQMIVLALHEKSYLDLSNYYQAIFDTPSVQTDEAAWKSALRNVVVYAVLAPYDNQQSDLMARIALEPKLKELPSEKAILDCFLRQEVMPWSRFQASYATHLGTQESMQSADAAKDLQKRLVEHNIRVICKFYTRITLARLAEILDVSLDETEAFLSVLVTNKTIFAKVDRPSGVVTFRPVKDPVLVLNEWSSEISSLMRFVDKATHLIAKERTLHNV
eukprot:m.68393 g.68393  ORF g.68393 m.68393 type:complete len:439 (+) comp14178_c0_seq1:76-1392(+)